VPRTPVAGLPHHSQKGVSSGDAMYADDRASSALSARGNGHPPRNRSGGGEPETTVVFPIGFLRFLRATPTVWQTNLASI
jgi:hypothetical protein